MLADNKLSVCGPIVQLLLNGIENRFKLMLTNTNAQLAAVVHPKFKCDWVLDEDERSRLVNILKRRMHSVASTASISHPADNNENPHTSATETSASPPKDFFAVLASRRQQAAAGVGCDIEEELSKYLSDSSADLNSLDRYSIQTFETVYHTEHWSASKCGVERLFSLGGRVFSPLRAKLSSKHFEMMLFLRCANF